MFSMLVFLVVLSVLIVVHELGHLFMAKKLGVRVEKFSLGFGKCILRKKRHETEYSLSAIPLGGYVKLAGDNLEEFTGKDFEYYSKSVLQRALIIFFGPLANYILGFLLFWLIFVVGFPTLTTRVGGVMPGFGAEDAGVKAGDKVVAVAGVRVQHWEEMQEAIKSRRPGEKVELSVLRGAQELTINVLIKGKNISDSSGRMRNIGLLGITPDEEAIVTIRHGPAQSILLAGQRVWFLTAMTCQAMGRMFTGRMSIRESVTGPLGVFFITSKVMHLGVIPVLFLLAALSVSLGIFNLLPLPLLDGGHLALLLIEKIRGKALSEKVEKIITQAGFSLIITLAVLVTYNDIVRIFGDKIGKLFK